MRYGFRTAAWAAATLIVLGAGAQAQDVAADPAAPASSLTADSATGSATGSAIKQAPGGFDSGFIQNPKLFRPEAAPQGVVFLISDAPGWADGDTAQAQALVARGYAVVGLDLPTYLHALAQPSDDEDCSYAISDIEEISKRLQSGTGADYRLPLIAGRGDGGGLALALTSQTPVSTIAATVAVDPSAGIALDRPLCTDAAHQQVGGRMVYGLLPEGPGQSVDLVFTPAAQPTDRAHAEDLAKGQSDITISAASSAPDVALATALSARIDQLAQAAGPLNLPVEELSVAKPAFDTMAIFYSGDGGWRDIDRQVGTYLQQAGVPVVGVDSLRYFWAERTPQQTADDLSRMIRHYRQHWGVKHVILVGYSFGADILPESYDLLPAQDQAHVLLMSLMSLTHERDYEVHVTGWLGLSSGSDQDPTRDLQKVPAGIVQCISGDGDDEDACHDLTGRGYDLVSLPGGHHFDGDYETLTGHILRALKARL